MSDFPSVLCRRLMLSGVAALSLLACSTAERHASADSGTTAATAVMADTGDWVDGDERIAWSSDIVDGAITEITEQVTFGTDGRAERVLRFTPEGVLTQYTETRTQTAQSPDRTPAPLTVQVRLAFAGDSLTSSSKTVDGADTPLQPYEIDTIKRHAAAIYTHLRQPTPSRN
ncbi:MAG: hypothetical protein ACK6DP_03530 [Gemmatimonas sp.]|jgi:hypothetical protein|uniref:hypothetical protein n=1 Tax=Gemmatimonas sp. TaxID=1962908 RepID=UPI00391F0181|nr:hypothetical protein [Gemmatimonadota bacterium]